VLQLCVQEKQLLIPRLSPRHEGLRIAHITDLHMSGRVGLSYFEQMVQAANRCDADLVAITGDIVEREKCVDWIMKTLGQLRARCGVYYVLGNHDRNVKKARLKTALAEAGLIYLGGDCREVTVNEAPLILAGNELPWFKPAPDLSVCAPGDQSGQPLRILLAHTPDQFEWAQANGFDLMLAGHLHGGQVRLPLFGALMSPSKFGVRYASGVFVAGNTVMHVSRGVGCMTPLRINCRPEIALLELRGGSVSQ
jgi:predicted MPP superfamily phosphohydrolase